MERNIARRKENNILDLRLLAHMVILSREINVVGKLQAELAGLSTNGK